MQRQLSLALALVTAGLLGTASPASAQQKATTPTPTASTPDSGGWNLNPAERLLQRKADLNLTDAQVKKLEDLKTKFAAKAPADTGRAAWKDRRKQSKEAMAVLTDEQRDKLHQGRHEGHAAWRAQGDSLHRERHGAMHHEPGDTTTTK